MTEQTRADKAHIEQLANELNAVVFYDEIPWGSANDPGPHSLTTYPPELHLAPWGEDKNPGGYFVALHELGHIASDPDRDRVFAAKMFDPEDLIRIEAEAWSWGLDNARRPLDSPGRAQIVYGLASYIFQAGPENLPLDSEEFLQAVNAVGAENVDFSLLIGAPTEYAGIARDTWKFTQRLALAA